MPGRQSSFGRSKAVLKLVLAGLLCTCSSARAQEPPKKAPALPMPTSEASAPTAPRASRPAPAGAPRYLKCEVRQWDLAEPKPVLTVACPPVGVFAPLRIHIGFSWERAEDIPANIRNVVFLLNTQTKIDLRPDEALIWLRLSENGEKKPREQWVRFTSITRIGVSTEP